LFNELFNMKRQTVVILGSNSFSGSDFIDYLLEQERFNVIGISRSPEKNSVFLPYKRFTQPRFRFYQYDLNQHTEQIINLLSKAKPNFIVNFAAQSEVAPSWEHPEHWFATNTVSLAKLLKYLSTIRYLTKYVHISSPEVYGTTEGKIIESAPLNPSTPYAASKAAADLLLLTYFKQFKFPVTFVRSTNVYGAHQQLFKIIPRSIIYLKLGSTIPLHGGGKAVKSYIHIRDVSRGQLLIMEKGRAGELYHLSPIHGVSVRNVVELICKTLGKSFQKSTKIAPDRPGQDKAYVIDSTKARRKLHWKPEITLERGIGDVVNWIETNWQEIRNLPHEYIHRE